MADHFSIGQMYPVTGAPIKTVRQGREATPAGTDFKQLLSSQLNKLKFSRHAEIRMSQRGIVLPKDALEKLSNAVEEAAAKGARDSLIVMNELAMIVNVPSRTVVTALEQEAIGNNVFTQIDSAVIIK